MFSFLKSDKIYILLGVLVVMIWGGAFICSKVIISNGLKPNLIFLIRFFIAYLCMACFAPKKVFSKSFKDELIFLLLGIFGGSSYFLAENSALALTTTSNVSFIVCSSPLFAMLLSLLFYKDVVASINLFIGALLALIGISLIVYNGKFVFHFSPLGDLIAFWACMSWALYCVIIKLVNNKYNILFVTRKVFFYGLLTALPTLFVDHDFSLNQFDFVVVANLLFLGVVSSCLCYLVWNYVASKIGIVRASAIIYLNPFFTLIASAIFLNEPLSCLSIMGSFMILVGVILSQYKEYKNEKV